MITGVDILSSHNTSKNGRRPLTDSLLPFIRLSSLSCPYCQRHTFLPHVRPKKSPVFLLDELVHLHNYARQLWSDFVHAHNWYQIHESVHRPPLFQYLGASLLDLVLTFLPLPRLFFAGRLRPFQPSPHALVCPARWCAICPFFRCEQSFFGHIAHQAWLCLPQV